MKFSGAGDKNLDVVHVYGLGVHSLGKALEVLFHSKNFYKVFSCLVLQFRLMQTLEAY